MPRKRGRSGFRYRGISVSLGPNGRYTSKVPVGMLPDGTPDRRNATGTTPDAVKARIDRLLDAKARKEVPEKGGAPTVKAWFTHWLTNIAPYGERALRGSSLEDYWSACRAWIFPWLGKKHLDELTSDNLDAMYAAMRNAGRAGSSVLKVHAVLRRGLEVAVHRQKIHRNVADMMDNPGSTKTKKRRRALSREQARKVLEVIARRPDRLRWELAMALGPRQGEVLGLRWSCVDLDAGEIVLDWQLQRQTYRHGCKDVAKCTEKHHRVEPCGERPRYEHGCGVPENCAGKGRVQVAGKAKPAYCPQRIQVAACLRHGDECPPLCAEGCTGHAAKCASPIGGLVITRAKTVRLDEYEDDDEEDDRGEEQHRVALPGFVVAGLKAHRRTQNAARLAAGNVYRNYDLVFCLVDGKPIDPDRDRQALAEILTEAGLRTGGTHMLRRTAATILLELGEDIAVVQEVLGHTDIRTTRGYTQVSVGLTRRAADAMNSELFGAPVTDIVSKRRDRGSS